MKNTSAGFKTALAAEDGNICICIRIVRSDGVQLGFTTWDSPFAFAFVNNTDAHGSITYSSENSFEPSQVNSSADLNVDNLEIIGVLSSLGIDAHELSIGIYNDAEVTFFKVDPENLANGEMIDKRGWLGEISLVADKYVAETLTSTAFLRRNVGNVTSPTCRVRRFCNAQCTLTEADYTYSGTTATHTPRELSITFIGTIGVSVSRFVYGIARISYGGKILEREIKEVVTAGPNYTVKLRESFGIELDDTSIELIEGCDRLPATCIAFGNMENFRGEPHLPGTDTLIKVGRAPS